MNLEFQGSGLKYIVRTFLQYDGIAKYLILYFVALLFIIIMKDKWGKRLFIYPVIVLIATIFNPFSVGILIRMLHLSQRYYRFIWLLPMTIVISYVATELISKVKSRKVYIASIVVVALVLIFCGDLGNRYRNYSVMENKYKVSVNTIQVSQILHRDTKKKNLMVAYPNGLVIEYRTYDPSVISLFGRDKAIDGVDVSKENIKDLEEKKDYSSLLYAVVTYGYKLPYKVLDQAIESTNVDYLVVNKWVLPEDYFLQDEKTTEVSQSQDYIVYRVEK